MRVLQRQPNSVNNVLEDGRYHRVLIVGDEPRVVTVEEEGTVDRPMLRVRVRGDALGEDQAEGLLSTLSDMLGVAVDLAPFYRSVEADPRFAVVVAALRGLKPPRFPTIFETLVNSVVFQQISLPAATAIVNRFVARFGSPLETDGRLYYSFPPAGLIAAATLAEVRSVGLTERKSMVLRHLGALVAAGELSFDMLRQLPSEDAIRVLTALPGIGRWTAELILLRGLGRLDVFPTGDVGVRRGLARALGQDRPLSAGEEQAVLEPFGPYRGYLYFCSLGWRLLQGGLIEPAGR